MENQKLKDIYNALGPFDYTLFQTEEEEETTPVKGKGKKGGKHDTAESDVVSVAKSKASVDDEDKICM